MNHSNTLDTLSLKSFWTELGQVGGVFLNKIKGALETKLILEPYLILVFK